MKSLWIMLKTFGIGLGAAIGYYVGPLDGLVTALLIFVSLDYVTGVIAGIATKTLDSRVGFVGILRKVLIFLVVGAANILDVHVIKTGTAIRSGVICYYLANEGLSMLENAGRAGVPYPAIIKNVLEQLNKEDD